MRLIFEDRLQRSLRDFRLIRRVRRQKLGAQQKLIDARRLKVRVRAGAEEREVIDGAFVFRGELAKPAPRFDLRPRTGHIERLFELDFVGDRFEETIDRVDADHGEHLFDVFFGVGDVSVLSGVGHENSCRLSVVSCLNGGDNRQQTTDNLFSSFFFNVLFVFLRIH